MLCVASRSIALPLLLVLSACPSDPSPIDTTDGSTTTDPSTSADPTTNTSPSTTDEPSTSSVDTTMSTTTTDPSDTDATTAVDTTGTTDGTETTDTGETTHGSHTTETAGTESSSSSAQETSSSQDSGKNPDCDAGDGPVFMVTNNALLHYSINGQDDPELTVVRGCEYTFEIAAQGHPFYLKTVQSTGVGNAYNTGVAGNGAQNGDITWTVADNAPDDLFYNCQFHAAMAGTITVIDP